MKHLDELEERDYNANVDTTDGEKRYRIENTRLEFLVIGLNLFVEELSDRIGFTQTLKTSSGT